MMTLPNMHPGEVLLEDFLVPLGISRNVLTPLPGAAGRRFPSASG